MDTNSLIPTGEMLPAPAWLLIILEQLLFLLHIIVVNAILGGMFIMLFRRIKSGGRLFSEDSHITVASQLPVLFALGINFAIPPLLFMQVVFGNLFYTSSVLMAVFWIIIIPLLVLGYYGTYLHRAKLIKSPVTSRIILSATIFILLYIGFMLVSNNMLMEHPETWGAYFDYPNGTILGVSNSMVLPRYLHFIIASVAIGGLMYSTLAWFGKLRIKDSKEKIKSGLLIFAIATSIQVAVGLWYLVSIPSQLLPYFMGKNMLVTLFLVLGICGGIASIIAGFLNNYILSIVALLFTLVCMVLNRLNLRLMLLNDNFQLKDLQLKPQYGVFALFLIILIIGVVSIIYMLRISSIKNERSIES